MRRLRLWCWLHVLDALVVLGAWHRRAYLWAVGRASDATDWGDDGGPEGSDPWEVSDG